jgi:hypothetical protein
MNFSHGTYEYHQSVIDNTRKAEEVQEGRQVAIALDTKGPEIRTGNTVGDKDIPIEAGKTMIFSTDEKYAACCDSEVMWVAPLSFLRVVWYPAAREAPNRGTNHMLHAGTSTMPTSPRSSSPAESSTLMTVFLHSTSSASRMRRRSRSRPGTTAAYRPRRVSICPTPTLISPRFRRRIRRISGSAFATVST